jgi:hypothetical protein
MGFRGRSLPLSVPIVIQTIGVVMSRDRCSSLSFRIALRSAAARFGLAALDFGARYRYLDRLVSSSNQNLNTAETTLGIGWRF